MDYLFVVLTKWMGQRWLPSVLSHLVKHTCTTSLLLIKWNLLVSQSYRGQYGDGMRVSYVEDDDFRITPTELMKKLNYF